MVVQRAVVARGPARQLIVRLGGCLISAGRFQFPQEEEEEESDPILLTRQHVRRARPARRERIPVEAVLAVLLRREEVEQRGRARGRLAVEQGVKGRAGRGGEVAAEGLGCGGRGEEGGGEEEGGCYVFDYEVGEGGGGGGLGGAGGEEGDEDGEDGGGEQHLEI